MRNEMDLLSFSKSIDKQRFKKTNDLLSQNENLEGCLNFDSSEKNYMDPMNFESSTFKSVNINNFHYDIEQSIFNYDELNNVIDVDPDNLSITKLNIPVSLENNNINSPLLNANDFPEQKNGNTITAPEQCEYYFEKDFDLTHSKGQNGVEKDKKLGTYEHKEFNNATFKKQNEVVKIDQDELRIEMKTEELKDDNYFKPLNEDVNKKDNLKLNILDKLPSNGKSEKRHKECALTNDFFETIENINTKVSEKYKNLKGSTENLIDIINKSEFEKRLSDLLSLGDVNSELIDKFKNKSEDCIRQCRKFETTSENLIDECINTIAQTSICYAEWVYLHSFNIDSIDKDLKDIQLFIETSQ